MDCFLCSVDPDEKRTYLDRTSRNSLLQDDPLELNQYGTSNEADGEEIEAKHEERDSDARGESSGIETWKTILCTNIIVCFMFTGYAGASITSQLTQANVLQINSIKYIIMACIGLVIAAVGKSSFTIKRQHFGKMAMCISLHTFYVTAYYFNASFMPVGNLEGLQSAFTTVMATAYDFSRKNISKLSVLSAMLTIIGIILLSQPWKEYVGIESTQIPCEYLQNVSLPFRENNFTRKSVDKQIDIYGTVLHWFQNNKRAISYTLIITSSLMTVTRGVLFKQLLKEYSVPPLLFWNSIFEGMISILLNLVWTSIFGNPFISFASSPICLNLSLMFVIFTVIGNIFSYYAYQRTFFSSLFVINIICSVFLYASQRTFLKQFHAGYANVPEIIGIIIVICGVSGSRLLSYYCFENVEGKTK